MFAVTRAVWRLETCGEEMVGGFDSVGRIDEFKARTGCCRTGFSDQAGEGSSDIVIHGVNSLGWSPVRFLRISALGVPSSSPVMVAVFISGAIRWPIFEKCSSAASESARPYTRGAALHVVAVGEQKFHGSHINF